jgi:hypothetical protein
MGRMITYLTILIMLDLTFIVTGQLCSGGTACSFTSIIFAMATNPSLSTLSDWFSTMIGNTTLLLAGVATVGALGYLLSLLFGTQGVSVGAQSLISRSDTIIFGATGVALSLLVGDLIIIFQYIYTGSPIVALFVMSPIIIIYIMTCVEWVRGMP